MKVKTLISAAMLLILVSQPAFGRIRMQPERIWRGGWTIIRIPVTPMPFPIYLPFQRSQLVERGHIRSNRNFIQERRAYRDRFKPFAKKTVQVRMPKW